MPGEPTDRAAASRARLLPVLLAAGVLVLHVVLSTRYGYFRDELYYIAASRHPALGYFDFPAGVAMVAWLVGHAFGDHLWALHLPPALAHAGLVLIAGAIASDAGAGAFGAFLAALAVAVCPAYLGSGSILTMDVFDELCWALAGWAALRALQRDRPRLWLWFGAAAALGLVFKMTMLMFGAAVLIGLVATDQGRRHLRTRWPWLGGLIAAAGLLPYILWEVQSGWPTFAFYGSYLAQRTSTPLNGVAFVVEQLLIPSVLSAPIWLAGLLYALRGPEGRRVRPLGIAYVVLFAVLAVFGAKSYFLDPMYTLLFGLGAPVVERWALRRRWRGIAYPILVVLAAAVLAPDVMPILSPAATVAYTKAPLQQPLADRLGWPQQVAAVAGVYHGLRAAERAQACIVASNYGEASALNFFGPAHGLPTAISGHNQYYLWGPHGCTFRVVVTIGLSAGQLRSLFASVRPAATIICRYCVPYESGITVDVAQDPSQPPAAIWARLRTVS